MKNIYLPLALAFLLALQGCSPAKKGAAPEGQQPEQAQPAPEQQGPREGAPPADASQDPNHVPPPPPGQGQGHNPPPPPHGQGPNQGPPPPHHDQSLNPPPAPAQDTQEQEGSQEQSYNVPGAQGYDVYQPSLQQGAPYYRHQPVPAYAPQGQYAAAPQGQPYYQPVPQDQFHVQPHYPVQPAGGYHGHQPAQAFVQPGGLPPYAGPTAHAEQFRGGPDLAYAPRPAVHRPARHISYPPCHRSYDHFDYWGDLDFIWSSHRR